MTRILHKQMPWQEGVALRIITCHGCLCRERLRVFGLLYTVPAPEPTPLSSSERLSQNSVPEVQDQDNLFISWRILFRVMHLWVLRKVLYELGHEVQFSFYLWKTNTARTYRLTMGLIFFLAWVLLTIN